jgi:hypothetical protein
MRPSRNNSFPPPNIYIWEEEDEKYTQGRCMRSVCAPYRACPSIRCCAPTQDRPFVCTNYMQMLLDSIMARVQRDMKVQLCHKLWMANHVHIIIVTKDKTACKQFYGEVQKQITEAVKRLLGLKHLKLWKSNGTSVIPIQDIDTACYRIALKKVATHDLDLRRVTYL